MRKKYFTLLLMFSCFALFAQNNVNINVTDAISALAIENADVTLNSSTLQTDVNGDVVFAAIADGVYPYTITNDCYLDVSGSVTVAGAEVFETATMNSQTSASVFIGSSSNMFGTFADGDITLEDGVNTYTKSVTEFDNLVTGVVFGTYNYTFTRPGACDVTGTVDVECSTIDAMSGNVPLFFLSEDQTSADVFIGSSSNMFGTFADGDITLEDGVNTYTKSVTEFDNLVTGVVFGTYNYTFTRPGACDVTGTVDVECSTIDAMSGNVPLFFLSEDQTSADVFIGSSSNMFGTFADGDITLEDGVNTYTKSVTEFDNLVTGVVFGTYNYTFTRPGACDVTGTVDVECSTIDAMSGNVPLFFLSEDQTSADVFIGSSSNMFGTFADGDITLEDGVNTYTKSVTEFDNLVTGVVFGTYNYTFTRPGACDVTGTVDVECSTIDAMSGNVPLFFLSEDQTSADVFIGSSSNMFGTFADGDITLEDGVNTYTKSVTEFDNLVTGVVFGTYNYTFTRPGACDVTGTVDVECSTIDAMSGNVPLFFLSEDQTSADVFIGSSSNMFGTFADGDITLEDGVNTYTKSVTEFDNLVTGVVFGTYNYTFTRPGACDVTGTVDVECSTIDAMSGNVPLFFLSEDQTSADVFIGSSSNMFGTFADGDITLEDGVNTYTKSVTEFDNLVTGVVFGTYNYTFTRPGACDVTGTVDVECSTIDAMSGNVPLFFLSEDQTSADVFIGSSSNMFGTFADGDITLEDGVNTYTKSVTEFDNLVTGVVFGTYNYTFTRPGACDVTGTVDVECSTIDAMSGNVPLFFLSEDQTSADVFIGSSSNMFGTFADGDITLEDGVNTYTKSVTEFDNLVTGVVFGTYNYTFTRPGACDVTGTVDVECSTIDAMSGNVPLFFLSEDQTSADVFIGSSSNMFGTFADGDITLEDGVNTYTKSVTEFDNLVTGVVFGTYNYTFTRPGACDVTGTVDVECSTIDAMSGNVPLFFLSEDQTSADVFIGSSSNMFGTFADGDITLEDGVNTYTKSVTEFDNLVTGVVFGTYNYTFTRPGACDVTGTVDVECSTIDAMSGNVPLFFLSEDATVDISVTQVDNVLTANATGASITYQWLDCNNGNAAINGETNQTFTATSNGSYAVVITDSACGVSDTSICYDVNSLSIDQIGSTLEVTLFPNPVKDNLSVSLNTSYDAIQLEIYALTGQLLKTISISNRSEFKVDISGLSAGMYLVRLNAEGKTFTSRILKN